MDERILKWLYDIQFSINEIDAFFNEVEKDFFQYKSNTMLKRAVERNLEIIGEAVNRIINRDNLYTEKISNAKDAICILTNASIMNIASAIKTDPMIVKAGITPPATMLLVLFAIVLIISALLVLI
jgi:hypothetical protein